MHIGKINSINLCIKNLFLWKDIFKGGDKMTEVLFDGKRTVTNDMVIEKMKWSAVLLVIGEGAQVIEEDMPPTTAERIRAAELIGKRYALFTDKQEINATVTPIFVDDISGDNNGS